jgi:hypothetical protein
VRQDEDSPGDCRAVARPNSPNRVGCKASQKIELDLLPDSRGVLKAARPNGTIGSFVGLLAGRTKKVATIEEINEVVVRGWAGKK